MAPKRERPEFTPTAWIAGDPGYEPVDNPPEEFFHVVALPDGDKQMALLVQAAYETGRPLDMVAGRRYLVNAAVARDARAQVERIEQQIAENDAEHQARYGTEPWKVGLVVDADVYLHARRDPDPAEPHEAWELDAARAAGRRQRAIAAGIA